MSDSLKLVLAGAPTGNGQTKALTWAQVKDYAMQLSDDQMESPVILWQDEFSGIVLSINEASEDLIDPSGDGVELASEYADQYSPEELAQEEVVYKKGHPILEVFFSEVENLQEEKADHSQNIYKIIHVAHWSRNIAIKIGSALDEIIKEREHQKQIGNDVSHDIKSKHYEDNMLINAAAAILRLHADKDSIAEFPISWPTEYCQKILRKPQREQRIIAAALILADLEMIEELELRKRGCSADPVYIAEVSPGVAECLQYKTYQTPSNLPGTWKTFQQDAKIKRAFVDFLRSNEFNVHHELDDLNWSYAICYGDRAVIAVSVEEFEQAILPELYLSEPKEDPENEKG